MMTTRRTAHAKGSEKSAKTAAPARPATKSRRITNVRANASVIGAAASLVPYQIVAARAPKK